jgi:thioredoxin
MDATTATFEADVVERSRSLPVVVDFWADWCGPCKALAPVLEREVEERNGRVELVKVDVDANPELAQQFSVSGIPAVKAFRDGRVVREFTGAQSATAVAAFLDALLAPPQAGTVAEELLAVPELAGAGSALAAGEHELAFEALLAALPGADADRRDLIRRSMVAVFGDLGQDHPLSEAYRRRLARALY